MGSAITLGDIVGVAEDILLVGLVPLHRQLYRYITLLQGKVKHLLVERCLFPVEMLYKSLDAPLVLKDILFICTIIMEDDAHP